MRIATWNVNSIKVRLPHLLSWLDEAKIDAVVLQETKTVDEAFPLKALQEAGFDAVFVGQKAYNGVALLTRRSTISSVTDPVYNIPGYDDEQKRLVAATITDREGKSVRFIGAYFPNGQEVGTNKYWYKLEWMAALTYWLKAELARDIPLLLGGDFNIAPSDEDLWDPIGWRGRILASAPEREAFFRLLSVGFIDTWSLELHAPGTFSWWDYRQSGFEQNHGVRIDHLLCSKSLSDRIHNVHVDVTPRGWDKPSDHAPVVADLSL
ncbi:MAG: exodeoxyribonuclease III [Duodenibacillus sp.]|nr:exodeoxyribonuclease III [Duodenibacillus sp.]